jgi:CRISPR-associated protein Cas2
MLLYIVAYDIACNKRRKKVSDLLEGYGQRVQFSVFECLLPDKKYVELRERLRSRVNSREDNVRFYPLSSHTMNKIEIWGGIPLIPPPGSIIV